MLTKLRRILLSYLHDFTDIKFFVFNEHISIRKLRIIEDEDASVLGLSSLSGAHGFLFPRVCDLLRSAGLDDVVVFGGGIIPQSDRPELYEAGVRAIFGPGTTTDEFIQFLVEVVERRSSNQPVGVGSSDGWHWS